MTKRIAVLLAGCGHRDGAEIHETTCTLLALDKAGVSYVGIAPNTTQALVSNHIDGSSMDESRNVRLEAARIMRGNVKLISDIKVNDIDALILPGGFGAALNLCNYGVMGKGCQIDKEVKALINECVKAGKPIGAICIAPVVVAKALEGSGKNPTLTIGNAENVAADINAMGATHTTCVVTDIVVDEANKIVTTPAYMLAERISEVETGISKLVDAVLRMA